MVRRTIVLGSWMSLVLAATAPAEAVKKGKPAAPAPAAQKESGAIKDMFDPEKAIFSKRSTIETWMDPRHSRSKSDDFKKIQGVIGRSAHENPFSIYTAIPIKNNAGDERYFGKAFHTLTDIELPFLQFVRRLSESKKPLTLEIAAGMGWVSWKVPLCFGNEGGTHYVNELSQPMMSSIHQVIEHTYRSLPALKASFVSDPGDVLKILERKPELAGRVDAIYVQNMEHFLNPTDHQAFLTIVNTLLAENGRAFLCAHAPSHFAFEAPALKAHFEAQRQKGDAYPAFISHDVQSYALKGLEGQLGAELSNPVRPADNARFEQKDLSSAQATGQFKNINGKFHEIISLRQRATSNGFTPEIYRGLIAKLPDLKVVDTFYLTHQGYRQASEAKSAFTGLIVEKQKQK